MRIRIDPKRCQNRSDGNSTAAKYGKLSVTRNCSMSPVAERSEAYGRYREMIAGGMIRLRDSGPAAVSDSV